MAEGNLQDQLPHENYINLPQSKPDDNVVEIKMSDILDLDQSVSVPKSIGEGSLDFNSTTNYSLFINSSNVSESDVPLVSDKFNNVNDEVSDSNIIGSDEDNDYAIIDQFENRAPDNVDDDCYVVASFKQTTSVKNRNEKPDQNNQSVSVVECVDLTEDEPEETKFQDSFAHEFTKDTRLCILLDVIPDADPDFLLRKVNEFKTDDDLQLFVMSALETQNYPKIGAIENVLPMQAEQKVRSSDYFLNGVVSKYNFTTSLNSSASQQSSLKTDGMTTTATSNSKDPNSTYFNSSEKGKISTPILLSPPVTSISATRGTVSGTRELSSTNSPFPVMKMQYNTLQRPVQYKMIVEGAKPHTVTSQEASYSRTSFNIPQAVASHSDVRYPGFSVQDLRVSQQGTERLGTPLSMYIPTQNIGSSTQTENISNPVNRTVNVSAHPVSSSSHIVAPNTVAPHATYIHTSFPPRPENFFQDARVWVPTNLNIFNPTQINNAVKQRSRRYYQQYRRHHGYDQFNEIPHLQISVADFLQGSSKDSTYAEGDNQGSNLLADVLNWADPEFLRSEGNKLKNDDDVEKFLIRAIVNEKMWNKCVNAVNSAQRILPGSASDKKYKILLELLPDASPTFLKQESVKLQNDEEVHEFAMKLGREQTYPKRKISNSSSKNKCIKRKLSEISDPETIDPKYQTLLDMLPDADPDFLLQESKVLGNPDDLQKFVLKAVEDNTYPKRDQFLERQEYHKQWKKYIENFSIKEFLQVIPNPVKYFYIDKVNSKNPLDMPGNFLQHRYKRKCAHYFGYFFKVAKHSLTKTCDILDVHLQTKPRKYSAWDQNTIFSTSILQEIAFIQNKKEIAHYLLFKEEMKLEAYEKGKSEGTLQECNCCYDDKLSEDMTSCLAGHRYCLNCIKRGSEVVIGNGGTKFPCYSEDCKEEFSFNILKTVLNPEVFSRLLIRKQYEEVNAAGIPGLETCSFCEFCSIPPAEDKLFRCLNPSCMKVTCRSCKKLDHLPLSCEEFTQKQIRLKMQSYVEDKMTEALVRTCWQCGTKFIKENGCNMMQCKCGAKMCYFCRQPVQNYHHFDGGKCGHFLDTTAYDEAAVIKVGKEAKQEVEAANPGYSLPNDPTKFLIENSKHRYNKDYY